MIPGANILNMALTVIGKQTVTFHKFQSRTLQTNGQWINNYAQACQVVGSFQPVPRERYEALGLDWTRNYATFHTSEKLIDLQRDTGADRITFCGRAYNVEGKADWINIDGWNGVLLIETGPDNVR